MLLRANVARAGRKRLKQLGDRAGGVEKTENNGRHDCRLGHRREPRDRPAEPGRLRILIGPAVPRYQFKSLDLPRATRCNQVHEISSSCFTETMGRAASAAQSFDCLPGMDVSILIVGRSFLLLNGVNYLQSGR
jgi:hypothetical protein